MIGRVLRAYREAFAGLPRDVWLQAAAMLINRSGTMVLPFLGLYLTKEQHLSAVSAGWILSLYGVGAAAGSFLGGWFSDRVGPIRVQQASLLGGGLGFVAIGAVDGAGALAGAVLATSLLADAFRPATFAAVTRFSAVEVRTRSLALVRLAANLGMSVGPALGGFLAVRHYGLLFWADAVTCWLAAGMLALAFPLARHAAAPASLEPRRAARSPWRDGPYLAFLALVTLLAVVFFQIMGTLPLYWREHLGLAEDRIGLLLALNTVIIVAVEMVLVRALEHRDHLRLTALGALLVCLGFGLMPLGEGVGFVAATIVVWTLGEMLSLPMTNAFASLRGGVDGAGRYIGAYMLAFSSAFILAPLAGTGMYQRFGADALWYGCGAVGILLAVGFALVSRAVQARAGAPAGARGDGRS